MRRIFLDTEFKNLPWTGHSEMLWIGLADESDNAWSAINADVVIDERASEFTKRVVVPRMTADEPRLGGDDLSEAISDFCGDDLMPRRSCLAGSCDEVLRLALTDQPTRCEDHSADRCTPAEQRRLLLQRH